MGRPTSGGAVTSVAPYERRTTTQTNRAVEVVPRIALAVALVRSDPRSQITKPKPKNGHPTTRPGPQETPPSHPLFIGRPQRPGPHYHWPLAAQAGGTPRGKHLAGYREARHQRKSDAPERARQWHAGAGGNPLDSGAQRGPGQTHPGVAGRSGESRHRAGGIEQSG